MHATGATDATEFWPSYLPKSCFLMQFATFRVWILVDIEGGSKRVQRGVGGPGGTDRRGGRDRGRGSVKKEGSLRRRWREWAESKELHAEHREFKGGVRDFSCEGGWNGRQRRLEFEGVQRRS
ncbi:hypothetical protein B0H16DRAFT_1460434 [Mycena metata]|uniref:Uncharacterized protein n=1 Tax=Mycena metata TaxID=1033252 RepID=A0AAD7IV21_9AGAR|nr:hypothetical protein B0H16DRAFT_1460434 [Mycena metata]